MLLDVYLYKVEFEYVFCAKIPSNSNIYEEGVTCIC